MISPQTCPICERALPPNASSALASFPFCSERCRNVDLWRWFEGHYAIVESLPPQSASWPERDVHSDGPAAS